MYAGVTHSTQLHRLHTTAQAPSNCTGSTNLHMLSCSEWDNSSKQPGRQRSSIRLTHQPYPPGSHTRYIHGRGQGQALMITVGPPGAEHLLGDRKGSLDRTTQATGQHYRDRVRELSTY